LPRHKSLRATLDWSHELLTEPERIVLRRLAVFPGGFSLEAASAIVMGTDLAASDVVDGLASLIAKSLVAAKLGGGVARFRLQNTTRTYALEKLLKSGERDRLVRRHEEYFRGLFARVESDGDGWPTAGISRPARGSTFATVGDKEIGVTLNDTAVYWADASFDAGTKAVTRSLPPTSGMVLALAS
jgi:predicted ATPase